jgi:hypothetical protein
MVRFSYEKLFIAARGDSDLIVKLFKENKASGISFINNENVIYNSNLPKRVLAEYLGICSLRNYAHYSLTNDLTLDLVSIPSWVPDVVLETNPLIKIQTNKIIFPYE